MARYSSNSKRGTGETARIAAEKRQTKAVSDWLVTSGAGPDYRPWLKVQTVPSRGRAHRLWSRVCGRVLHLLSDLEADCARVLDWGSDVLEIREQYPLLPIEATEQIADAIGVRHPTHPRSHHHVVMTTDFVIIRGSSMMRRQEAIAVKQFADLATTRTLEKLEIERQYWATRSTDWGITTQREIPRALVRNLEWIAPARDLMDFHISPHHAADVREDLFTHIVVSDAPLSATCADIDGRLSLPAGTSLYLVRHALNTRTWRTDLTVEIRTNQPLLLTRDERLLGFRQEVA